jgi:arylformamidase
MNGEGKWIDISVPLKTGMVHYPGDPVVQIVREQDISRGDMVNVSRLALSAHSGTHIDAPLHFCEKGTAIDQIPIEAITGKARVIEVRDDESIKPSDIGGCGIGPGEIILFKTRNSLLWSEETFNKDHVYLSTEAALLLVEKKVRTVGIDYLSIGGFERNEVEAHLTLLDASIWIIEGLDLSAASGGFYEFVCLPLRIAGGEAAPARAIIRPLSGYPGKSISSEE